jgi:FtsH-binding integral membrane protein
MSLSHASSKMFALTAVTLLFAAGAAHAADNATATASANIITPIAVTSSQNLVFGNLLAGTGGAVTVSPLDARTKSGGVTLLTGTTPTAAHFHVAADTTGGATYAVAYTKTDLSGPGPALVLSAITADVAPTSGDADIKVGATITLASGQTAGTYSGSVTATATYN